MIERLLLWFVYWGKLLDGIIGIVTFGIIATNFALRFARILSKYRYERRNTVQK